VDLFSDERVFFPVLPGKEICTILQEGWSTSSLNVALLHLDNDFISNRVIIYALRYSKYSISIVRYSIDRSNGKRKRTMKSYLELNIPLSSDSVWYRNLLYSCRNIPVRWQKGSWHVTIAFLDETPDPTEAARIITEALSGVKAWDFVFDTIDVFTTGSGKGHVINLTASAAPEEFMKFVTKVRGALSEGGCTIQSGFRLHITLGRVNASDISLGNVRKAVGSASAPLLRMTPVKMDLLSFPGHGLIRKWTLPRE